MGELLEVEGISKRFANGRGIRNVSFRLAKGDIFGFIGPNGAGKTTVLKIITGLLQPDEGSVRIFGHSVADSFEQAIERVGCLIEKADAYEYMTAYDNLKLSARFYPGIPKSGIDQVLEQVGLTSYKKERVGVFSLGMKQRLALASALLSNPQLVLLDEPANGLDVEGMVELRVTIARLAREQGMTFLISSHMIHDLGMIANRIGILNQGELICTGEVQKLIPEQTSLEQYVVTQIQNAKVGS